jgi:hypothetical protein
MAERSRSARPRQDQAVRDEHRGGSDSRHRPPDAALGDRTGGDPRHARRRNLARAGVVAARAGAPKCHQPGRLRLTAGAAIGGTPAATSQRRPCDPISPGRPSRAEAPTTPRCATWDRPVRACSTSARLRELPMITPRNARGRPPSHPVSHPRNAEFPGPAHATPAPQKPTHAWKLSRRRWHLPMVNRRAHEGAVLAAFADGWELGLGARVERGAA